MRNILRTYLAAALLAPAALLAQPLPAELSFDNAKHNFGTLKEEQNEASHTFTFTNKGKTAVTLTDVKPSCGCTTPDWTRGSVAPGKTGMVKATYSTIGRPGPFNKTITVRARPEGAPADGSKDLVAVLQFEGTVTPKRLGIADYYPFQSGQLRMNTNNVSFNKVYHGQNTTSRLKLYNDGETPVTFRKVEAPAHVTVALAENTMLKPKDSTTVDIKFDAANVNDWGFVSDRFLLHTDDSKEPIKFVYVTALIEEDFSKLSDADKANAPVAAFDSTTYHFGTVNAGTVVNYEFKFTNKGNRDLVIRKTKPSCGCTASEPSKSTLKPGESSSIKVSFDTNGRTDRQVKYITVITNDPKNPMVNLALDGTVKGTAPAKPAGK